MTENQVLKEKLDPERILLNNDQRRRLAVKGEIVGRKRLREIGMDSAGVSVAQSEPHPSPTL